MGTDNLNIAARRLSGEQRNMLATVDGSYDGVVAGNLGATELYLTTGRGDQWLRIDWRGRISLNSPYVRGAPSRSGQLLLTAGEVRELIAAFRGTYTPALNAWYAEWLVAHGWEYDYVRQMFRPPLHGGTELHDTRTAVERTLGWAEDMGWI